LHCGAHPNSALARGDEKLDSEPLEDKEKWDSARLSVMATDVT